MLIKQILLGCFLVSAMYVFLSNANGVPQAVTKAPGEANHNACATCHTPSGNYNPSISLELLKQDSTIVTIYEPGQKYIVRVKVEGINNPKAYGFQMSCLDTATESDMGIWSSFGNNVKQQNLVVKQKARKYLVQSSPKQNGIFEAQWLAPQGNTGAVTFYFAGLAINQNGNTSGDNSVFGQKTIDGPPISAVETDILITKNNVFPNPVGDIFFYDILGAKTIQLFSTDGNLIYNSNKIESSIDASNLLQGIYLVVFRDENQKIIHAQKIIKH